MSVATRRVSRTSPQRLFFSLLYSRFSHPICGLLYSALLPHTLFFPAGVLRIKNASHLTRYPRSLCSGALCSALTGATRAREREIPLGPIFSSSTGGWPALLFFSLLCSALLFSTLVVFLLSCRDAFFFLSFFCSQCAAHRWNRAYVSVARATARLFFFLYSFFPLVAHVSVALYAPIKLVRFFFLLFF